MTEEVQEALLGMVGAGPGSDEWDENKERLEVHAGLRRLADPDAPGSEADYLKAQAIASGHVKADLSQAATAAEFEAFRRTERYGPFQEEHLRAYRDATTRPLSDGWGRYGAGGTMRQAMTPSQWVTANHRMNQERTEAILALNDISLGLMTEDQQALLHDSYRIALLPNEVQVALLTMEPQLEEEARQIDEWTAV